METVLQEYMLVYCMARKVHSGEMRERQNMRDSRDETKGGTWCVVGFCDDWEDGVGLQGWSYKSESIAEEAADQLDSEDEFAHVSEHRVMRHDEFEQVCTERGIDRTFPWE
jgi:hypothetical protein